MNKAVRWLGVLLLVMFFQSLSLGLGGITASADTATLLKDKPDGMIVEFAGKQWKVLNSWQGFLVLNSNDGDRRWDDDSSEYANSEIRAYLNGTFLNSLGNDNIALIRSTSWDCSRYNTEGYSYKEDSRQVDNDKIGLPNYCQLVWYGNSLKEDYGWWTMSPYKDDSISTGVVWIVNSSGHTVGCSCDAYRGVRPVLYLKQGLYVSDDKGEILALKLNKPAKPELNNGIASWSAVANENNGYCLQLYKDGSVEGETVEIANGNPTALSYDFSDKITTAGSYTVTVSALGKGYVDSDPSVQSDPQLVTEQLAKPEKPTFISGTVTWTAVDNENNGYSLQLYKDGSAEGAALEIDHSAPLSYDFSGSMAGAGSYTVTVAARGTGIYADSVESDHSDPYIITALDKPAKPGFNNGTVTWAEVDNENNGYSLQLYKDGIAEGAPIQIANGTPTSLSYSFSDEMKTAGSYTVTVAARGTGIYADSVESDHSDPYIITALDKPAKPGFNNGTVTWAEVDNENNGYSLQLYKDGSAVGVAVEIANGAPTSLSYDFSASLTTAGSYTVTVSARGTGIYADSEVSDPSDPYIVTALVKPAKPTLTDGIAAWTAVPNENDGYSLQLYKDGSAEGAVVEIANGAPLSHAFSASMTGVGSYTVTVTARGELPYLDSVESDQSETQTVTEQLATPAKPVLLDGTANWAAAAHENNGYSLQLYKDGNAEGAPVQIPNGDPTALCYDFSDKMTGTGIYTVTVITRGTGLYLDSEASEPSDPQLVVDDGGKDGQAQLPSGTTDIQMDDNSGLNLSSCMEEAAGGQITLGGLTRDMNEYSGGSLNNVDLNSPQNVGGQTIQIQKGVRLESGTDGQPITMSNSGLSGVSASIPDGTGILAPVGWDGKIAPPKKAANIGTAPSGFSVGNTVIEVGASDAVLLFDKPVILTLEGVTGSVGYKPAGSDTWVKITQEAGGTYANPTAPAFPGEAYISNGTDTKIITWHFTSFASLEADSSSGPRRNTRPVNSTTGQAAFKPSAGGTVGLGSEAELDIPAGALQGSAEVEVKISKVTAPPTQPSGFMFLGNVYEFTVGEGKHYDFDKPVTLTFTFDTTGMASGIQPQVYYYDEDAGQWVSLKGEVTGDTISITVNHLTKFAVMAEESAGPTAVNLTDITGHWAEDNIRELVSSGVIKGYADGSFKPDNTITRAEFAKVLVEAFQLEETEGKVFADTAKHWAKDVISAAADCGVVNGYDANTFGPDDPVTREQMAVMTVKAINLEKAAGCMEFADSSEISNWAGHAVNAACSKNIMSGYPDNTFCPKANASRAEAATIITRAR